MMILESPTEKLLPSLFIKTKPIKSSDCLEVAAAKSKDKTVEKVRDKSLARCERYEGEKGIERGRGYLMLSLVRGGKIKQL